MASLNAESVDADASVLMALAAHGSVAGLPPGGPGCSPANPGAADAEANRPTGGCSCPRCASTDTKFCYFNNYNVKQPRFFCKVRASWGARPGPARPGAVVGFSHFPSQHRFFPLRFALTPAHRVPLFLHRVVNAIGRQEGHCATCSPGPADEGAHGKRELAPPRKLRWLATPRPKTASLPERPCRVPNVVRAVITGVGLTRCVLGAAVSSIVPVPCTPRPAPL
jgi:hypothetical protein